MRKNNLLFIILASGVLLTGCKKGFLDLNENPNFPSSVPAAALVAAAEVKMAQLVVDPNLQVVPVWMDEWAFSPNYAVNQDSRDYKITTSTGAGFFTNSYTAGFDCQKIIDFAVAQANPALEGIGRTMKAIIVEGLVDVYNNVPYSTAFLGAVNKTPSYDDGKTVYEALYNELTLAIAKFNDPTAVFPSATQDIMFKGNQAKWVKFANTLRLRLLMRQANRADRATYIAGKLATDFPAGLSSFLQAGELATVNPGYVNSDTKQTPFWANFGYSASGAKTGNNDFYKASAFAANFYCSVQDDRGFYVMKSIGNASGGAGAVSMFGWFFRGNEMGSQGNGALTYSDVMANGSIGGSVYRAPTQDQPVISDWESLFLQAEAVQRGWFAGSAQNLFNSAMLQSYIYMFDKVDGPGAGASYLSGDLIPTPDNNWALATDKIKLIITQKWAALNTTNFLEAWCDYRRTGFPVIPLSSSASRGPNIPYRFKYPQAEYDNNGANVGAQGTIDQFTSKIWWMP